MAKKIDVGRDFSRYPAGRYLSDGPYNGQKFREDFLIPALNENADEIEVILTNARGLKSSFLEEAFGGLVRLGYEVDVLIKRLKIVSRDPTLQEEIRDYIRKSSRDFQGSN